jgi:hypothetical protein
MYQVNPPLHFCNKAGLRLSTTSEIREAGKQQLPGDAARQAPSP